MEYTANLDTNWFDHMKARRKTVEGRIKRSKWAQMRLGDIWRVSSTSLESFTARITRITEYESFREYLHSEGLAKTLPGVSNIDEGISVYRRFFSEEDERTSGVIAFELEIIDS